MSKTLLSLLGVGLLAVAAPAALLLDEPFDYPDGSLISVSGVWSNHSGTLGQVDVTAGQVNLTQSESEDVNRLIPGYPFTNGYLYASFVVNFSSLPSGAGTYFAHFKDAGTLNFKARVFATTAGAATGKYRVGIANGGTTFEAIPTDLSLNSNYTLVVRYDCGPTPGSTLWINPNTETSASDRAEATDSTPQVPIHAFALRQSLSSGNGMGTLTLDNLKIATTFCEVVTCGSSTENPPSISGIPEQRIPMNGATPAIPFIVFDSETPPAALVVTAVSDNPTLVPNTPANIALSGTDSNRTITITPALNQQGVATITITVVDGDNNTTQRAFLVVVGAPSISSVPNQITAVSTPTAPIAFTVGDAETPAGSLALSMYSLNPTLVPPSNVVFGGSGSNRTAVITPTPGQTGLAEVGFVVSDGTSTASNRFILTVAPALGLDTTDDFSYPDGPLVPNSGFAWNRHSGGTNELQVLGGQVQLTSAQSEDVNRFVGFSVGDGYFATNRGWVLYNSFAVKFSALPFSDYFAHYKDLGTVNYRARVFATTNGAAPGRFRLGIANATATPSAIATNDLSLGVTYQVMVRYNVGTAESKLWVNPASESSYGVEATDVAVPVDIWQYAFRQNAGIGTLSVDDLKVAGTFALAFVAPNWPPSISSIPDQTTPFNTPTPALPFTIGDAESAADGLTLSATSSNTTLVPVSQIVFGGSGSNRTVTITPAAGESGTTLITLTVTDPGGQPASTSFLLTVLGPNNPPSISPIPDQLTGVGTPTPAIPFTIFDLETPAADLTLRATSSNPALVPEANIQFGGSGSNRTITVTPAAGQFGAATITVFVDDGVFTNSTSFTLSVNLAVLLADRFNYADGSILTNSGFFWTAHSGATGETRVVNGKLHLTGSQTEDINAPLTNAPFTVAGGAVLYAGFTVNFSALPGSNYFAHFRDTGTGFRGRVYATVNGAAPGKFRLGIANNTGSIGATNPPLAQDLDLNTDYRLVLRYHVGTGVSTLWVNPTAETDASVTAADTPSTLPVSTFAFRQATGIGTLTVDDLIVGTSFATALGSPAAPPTLTIVATGPTSVRIAWPKAASDTGYVLQHTPALPGGWSQYSDQGSVVGDERVVELNNVTGVGFFQLAKP